MVLVSPELLQLDDDIPQGRRRLLLVFDQEEAGHDGEKAQVSATTVQCIKVSMIALDCTRVHSPLEVVYLVQLSSNFFATLTKSSAIFGGAFLLSELFRIASTTIIGTFS